MYSSITFFSASFAIFFLFCLLCYVLLFFLFCLLCYVLLFFLFCLLCYVLLFFLFFLLCLVSFPDPAFLESGSGTFRAISCIC